jgi:hypothetical protein
VRAGRGDGLARFAVPAALAAGAAVRLEDRARFVVDAPGRIESAMMIGLPEELQSSGCQQILQPAGRFWARDGFRVLMSIPGKVYQRDVERREERFGL